jgi:hypothetical protein
MKNSNVSAIDGIPGIMPGIKSLLPTPPFNVYKITIFSAEDYHSQKCRNLSKTQVRDCKQQRTKRV